MASCRSTSRKRRGTSQKCRFLDRLSWCSMASPPGLSAPLTPLVIADIMRGTGLYNLAQGTIVAGEWAHSAPTCGTVEGQSLYRPASDRRIHHAAPGQFTAQDASWPTPDPPLGSRKPGSAARMRYKAHPVEALAPGPALHRWR